MSKMWDGGWYAHIDYDIAADVQKVYIVHGKPPDRHRLSFGANGDMLMTRIDAEHPIQPTFLAGDLVGIVRALDDAIRRGGYKPDEEARLRSELDATKGTLAYSQEITDRLLTHLMEPKQ